jgi:hypothetical protein
LRETTVGGILIEAAADAPNTAMLVEARADGLIGRR